MKLIFRNQRGRRREEKENSRIVNHNYNIYIYDFIFTLLIYYILYKYINILYIST